MSETQDTRCVQCKQLTGTVLLGSEKESALAFCAICAISQLVCDAMQRQGMSEQLAAAEWRELRHQLDHAYEELRLLQKNDPTA